MAERTVRPQGQVAASAMVSFSGSDRPQWRLDRSLDVPVAPERLDLARARAAVPPEEAVLPSRLASTDLLRTDATAAPTRTLPGLPAVGSAYDGCLAVGREHLLIAENFAVAVYAKASGAQVSCTNLADWFPGRPSEAIFVFDPRAAYDQYADRWIVIALAWNQPVVNGIQGSWMLLSASQGADPTGQWRSSVIDTFNDPVTPEGWADYPSLGIDEQAVYVTYNVKGGAARLLIFAKADIYEAGSAAFFDLPDLQNPDGTEASAVQPCHHFGPTPSAYLVNTIPPGAVPSNTITLWTATWSSGTPALTARSILVDDYAKPPKEAAQLGEKALDVGGVRVRGAVSRADSVWFAFATAYASRAEDDAWMAARWCRVDATAGDMVRRDELAEEGAYYVFPGLVVDQAGNLTMVCSRSAPDEHPSLHYGTWPTSGSARAGVLVAGRGAHLKCRGNTPCSQLGARNGWGDYNGIALDPSDGTTVWVFGGVGHESDKTLWATAIVAL